MSLDRTQRWILIEILVALIAMDAGFSWFADHYRFGYDGQVHRCLPERFFLISLDPHQPQRGELLAFKAERMEPFFRSGTTVVKVVAGVPGDDVEVKDGALFINGISRVLLQPKALERIGKTAEQLARHARLADGQYLVLGTEPGSYDGRYWGAVEARQVVGQARALW